MFTRPAIMLSVAIITLITLLGTSSAQQPTACTSDTNVSSGAVFGANLNNVNYNIVENFVTPDYAGITINGASYNLYPNAPVTINYSTGAYIEITQINYVPRQHTVDLILCSSQQNQNTFYIFNLSSNNYGDLYFPYYGTVLQLSSSSNSQNPTNVTISNLTTSTPSPPSGYSKLTALDIGIVTAANPVTINMTQNVPCYLSASTVNVYKLIGGAWNQIHGFTYNSSSCKVTLLAPQDPIIGIFYNQQGTTSSTIYTTSTSVSTTSIPTTSTSSSTTYSTSSSSATTTIPSTTVQSTSTIGSSTSTTATIGSTVTTSIPTTTQQVNTSNPFASQYGPIFSAINIVLAGNNWTSSLLVIILVVIILYVMLVVVVVIRDLLSKKTKKENEMEKEPEAEKPKTKKKKS